MVLSSVRLNLILADADAVLSSEHVATSDAYDGTLQPLGDGYFRYGDPPTVIQVKTTWDSARSIASDDITHELNGDTFDAGTADLLGRGASFSTTPLIGRPVPGSNGGVIESGDSDGDAGSGGSYTADGRIVSQLRTETVASPGIVGHESVISDTRDRIVKDGSSFGSQITVVTSPQA